MARTVALSDLRNRVRRIADVRSTARWTNGMIDDLINEAVTELTDLLIRANPSYGVTSSMFGITSGTKSYALPGALYKLNGVDILDDDGNWKTLERFTWGDRNWNEDGVNTPADLKYTVMGDNIVFHASPNWTRANGAKLWYVPIIAKLVGDLDTIDGVNGYDKYVVYKVAIEVMVADEQDITQLSSLLAMQVDRIVKAAKNRDLENPPKIRMTQGFLHRRRYDLPRP
jgi:hypothetical protein